jgi:folate-dependent phosphoribosylglycinamide formyltransferase PurN
MVEYRFTDTDRMMNVVFFFSGGASSMKAVLESSEHGTFYQVVGAITNRSQEKAERGWGIANDHGIKPIWFDPKKYETREKFYEAVTYTVEEMRPDIIGLSGFLYKYSLIANPFLRVYKNRILNVHPADLAIIYKAQEGKHPLDIGRDKLVKRNEVNSLPDSVKTLIKSGWRRIYTGDDAVNMAVLFGEKEICSSIHSVTEDCDAGPILVQSKREVVDREYVEKMLKRNAFDRIATYAHDLQEKMKTECDGPAFCKALELLAKGNIGIDDNHVTLDGKILPYGGYQILEEI